MKRVVDGVDDSGVTRAVGWNGGGGFRYYRPAPSLLQQDRFGQWVINKAYNPEMLAAAVAKLEGFTFVRTVNTTQVVANWLIGREIVEAEQRGQQRPTTVHSCSRGCRRG